jgi:drug/metabolite transporter (DMT)-like permease
MLTLAAGAAAALAFGVSTICSARASRMIGAASTLGWVAVIGLAVTLPLIAAVGMPDGLDRPAATWLFLGGAGNALGLLFAYRGLQTGKLGVIGPILSTEGAVAALLAVLGGQTLTAPGAVALTTIALGVVLAGIARSTATTRRGPRAGVAWAAAAAVAFGVSLYATGRAGAVLPLAWALLPPRLLATLAVTLPLAATRRLRLARGAAPLVAAAGLCEVAGFSLYTLGARHDIAVTAVLVSLFGAVAAVLGRLVFKERLARVQLAGVATIVMGVAALTASTAA